MDVPLEEEEEEEWTSFDGALFTWGFSGHGQLGSGDRMTREFSNPPEKPLEQIKADSVSCGGTMTCIIEKETGRILQSGGNSTSNSSTSFSSSTFVTIPKLETAICESVSCGGGHSLAMEKGGLKVFLFGDWLGKRINVLTFDFSSKQRVSSVSCGSTFAFIVLLNGNCLSFGSNDCGQLGLGDTQDRDKPNMIKGLNEIEKVACGGLHSILMNRKGQLYSVGSNKFGQLGLGNDKENRLVPTLVTNLPFSVWRISCGDSHSFTICDTQDEKHTAVYCWGRKSHCGIETESDILVPTPLEKLNNELEKLGEFATQISCNGAYNGSLNAVITNVGKLYLFGHPPGNVTCWKNIPVNPTLCNLNALVKSVSCGWLHIAAITNKSTKVSSSSINSQQRIQEEQRIQPQEYYNNSEKKPKEEKTPQIPQIPPSPICETRKLSNFLDSLGLGCYFERFHEDKITMSILKKLTGDEFKELGVKIGDRKVIIEALNSLETTETTLGSIPGFKQCILENITLKHKIGEGSFGQVYLALMEDVPVAAKKLKSDFGEISDAFLSELKIFVQMRNPHCVLCYGIYLHNGGNESGPEHYLVSEFMDCGPLDLFLRMHDQLPQITLLRYASDIASGMKFLTSLNIVHRDLAARNVLLSGGGQIAKISDFGLARCLGENDYYRSQTGRIAVKWCSIEALLYRKFSSKSDVWSFGVLCWEIFSSGAIPYSELQNNEVLPFIQEGKRLARPNSCSKDLYSIMLETWNQDPDQRPTFSDIHSRIETLVHEAESSGQKSNSLITNSFGSELSTTTTSSSSNNRSLTISMCKTCHESKMRECIHSLNNSSVLEFGFRVLLENQLQQGSIEGSANVFAECRIESRALGLIVLTLSNFTDRGGLYKFSFESQFNRVPQSKTTAEINPGSVSVTATFLLARGWNSHLIESRLYSVSGAICDHCATVIPPTDAWFHCFTCGGFDLCTSCFEKHGSEHSHSFTVVKFSSTLVYNTIEIKEENLVNTGGTHFEGSCLGDPKVTYIQEERNSIQVTLEWSHQTLHSILAKPAIEVCKPPKKKLTDVFSRFLMKRS